jgi:hypothetical protein
MITQRYTPPTCTLELTAKQPWLSRLRGESILDDVEFQLRFDDPRLPKEEYISVSGDRHQLQHLHQAVHRYVQQFLKTPVQPNAIFDISPANSDSDIHLKSDGVLYHHLFLGSLAPQSIASDVHLSALQLFDLDSALQECITELADLPTRKSRSSIILPIARNILTIGVSIGALTGLIKLINASGQEPTLTAEAETETEIEIDSSTPQPLSPPNLVAAPKLEPLPTPTPTTPPTPATLSPNLPAVTTAPLAFPSPIFPDTANLPTPTPFPELTPTQNEFVIIPREPVASSSITPSVPSRPSQPNNTPIASPANLSPAPAPVSPPVGVNPIPPVIQLPPLQNPGTPVAVNPPIPESNIEILPSTQEEENQPVSYLAQLNKRPQTIAATREEDTTLFDQIPQVAEVRNYFQQNWYPPKSLNRSLQYSLQLNEDGSLQSITPIGQPSMNRLQQIQFPTAEEPFVSSLTQQEPVKIRVILQPSGRVQTFLETLN